MRGVRGIFERPSVGVLCVLASAGFVIDRFKDNFDEETATWTTHVNLTMTLFPLKLRLAYLVSVLVATTACITPDITLFVVRHVFKIDNVDTSMMDFLEKFAIHIWCASKELVIVSLEIRV